MSLEMYLFNIGLLIILFLLIENGLRKTVKEKSILVTRVYWSLLFPTYISTTIFTILLLVMNTATLELLFNLQRYSIGIHVIACLLFIAALNGARTSAKVIQ